MRPRQSTKSIEYGNAFHAARMLGEEWKLAPREAPDFLVTTAECTFGLEVAECQIGEHSRKGSKARRLEGDNQKWLDRVRADHERQSDVSLHVRYFGGTTTEAREELLEALLKTDFSRQSRLVILEFSLSGGRALAFETPNPSWTMPDDRTGEPSQDGAYLQRVIDEKAKKLPTYREACPDIRLLVVADQIYNSGKLALEPGFRPDLQGFDAIYFLAYPRSVTPFYRSEIS